MKEVEIKQFGFKAWIAEQDGETLVAVRPICRVLGIQEARQRQKIMSDSRFNWIHMYSVGEDGKQREMLCIPVNEVAGWLWGINSRKVSHEIAPMLERFQRELQGVINSYIRGELTYELVDDLRNTIKLLLSRVDMQDEHARQQDAVIDRQGKEILELRQELDRVGRAHRFSGKAASYGMHARKAMKHVLN
jgi:hypothetical protein